MADGSAFATTYNSYSGTDIRAVFGNKKIGELQAISYSITREKGPIYTMGSPDPRAFARGKRGIAGTLIFIMFDQPALINALKDLKFWADSDEIMPSANAPIDTYGDLNLKTSTGTDITNQLTGLGSLADRETQGLNQVVADTQAVPAWYVDQLPPFDVTLAAANEYGAVAVMKIWGVEILNEGYGVSIDDVVSEEQMTYVARAVTKWHLVSKPRIDSMYASSQP